MPGGTKGYIYLNKPGAAGLLQYVWPFCYYEALKG